MSEEEIKGLAVVAYEGGRFVALFQRDNPTNTWKARAEDGTMVPVDGHAAMKAIGDPELFLGKSKAEMFAIAARVARQGIA